jgi:TonB family protein
MADAATRHGRGLLVVLGLAFLFFVLLALIILRGGGREERQAQLDETLTVLPMRIRIRTEPHARAPVVTTASAGERLKLIEDRGGWVRVRTGDNLEGWAERANLERTAEQQRRLARYKAIRGLPPLKGKASERTQLYAGPGIFYPLVGELEDSADVVVYTRDHDFYAIEHGTGVAYASVDAVDVTASGSRQLDVQTTQTEPSTLTDTTATTTSIAETAEPPPLPEPTVPEPEPRPEPVDTARVYVAVPPGGTQPQELDRVIPRYPRRARDQGVQGPVVVRGIVRRDGTIDNVEVIKDLPFGLGDEARRAVSRWRFRPATFRGEPIDVYYTVTVNFRLQ